MATSPSWLWCASWTNRFRCARARGGVVTCSQERSSSAARIGAWRWRKVNERLEERPAVGAPAGHGAQQGAAFVVDLDGAVAAYHGEHVGSVGARRHRDQGPHAHALQSEPEVEQGRAAGQPQLATDKRE